jgi:type I restriction enzyme S subunit
MLTNAPWKEMCFGEICDEIYDGPHATPEKIDRGPVFLSISSLVSGRIDLSQSAHLSEQDFVKWTRRILPQKDDLVFSYETRLGEAALIPDGLRCCLGRRMALVRAYPELVYPRYLLYFFLSPLLQNQIRQATICGSTVERLALADIAKFRIPLPPLAEQKAITAVLEALDDKIELNRRMNATLEAMARALFQSWFVDFDPVRAKLDGRPPAALDSATAALFPDSFEHCDQEIIPSGWRMVPIAEIADINYGNNLPATELRHAGFPVYGAAGVVGFYSTSMFEEPVTLVTSRGSGSGTVHQTYEPAFITNNSFTVIPRSEWLGRHYLRFSLLNADILSLVTGSAQPQLTITNFSYLKLLEPSRHVAVAFHKLLDPLWNKAAANDRESRTLATLRDTLLPKLLSGELSVAGAAQIMEHA